MHKKGHKLKTSPLVKNPQFSSNLADIQAKLPTNEVIILTKFHKECKKIADILLRQKILACALFYASPFSFYECIFSGSFDACQIDEVREVGAYKKGTMITGDNVADVVIVLKTMPTKESVNLLGKKILETMIEKNLQDGLKMLSNDRGFDLTTPKATVAIHISTIGPNVKNIGKLKF